MSKRCMVFGLFLVALFLTPTRSWSQSGITDQSRHGVTCASDDGRRHYCAVNTSRGVQMVKQRSGSPCIQGQTWGYDRRGIWVDRGCRAEFALLRASAPGPGPNPNRPGPGPAPQLVTCASNNGQRSMCAANTARGVQLVKQRSRAACIQGRTWGFTQRGIWVDRGCIADFALGRR